ncbi:SMP-30/gluconolactonase/LRE family protein [Sorangium sp. So ce1000]|uniref:SMP-30/gluconolactonase/LRE family protein n=1 Tax=Sorangium sp. So ce1000 TaxID=3133325 RepID=UPI003F64386F
MKRGYRLLGWALLLSGAPSACSGGDVGPASAGRPSATSGAGEGGAAAAGAGEGGAAAAGAGEGGGAAAGAGEGGAAAGSAAGTGGAGAAPSGECAALAPGPFEPALVTDVFSGSEDFAFDGHGYIVAKQGPNLVRFDATGQTSNFASLPGTVLGLRYRPDGTLVAALPARGAVVQISRTGIVGAYVEGLTDPEGLAPDAQGNVWATDLAGDRVIRLNPDATVDEIASGAPEVSGPNGIVFDPARRAVFYTNSSAGEIRRIDLADPGERPSLVATVASSVLDGLVLDKCGHLYTVDNGNRKLYRVRLDRGGAALGEAELLARFPTGVANAQFGSGPGFDTRTIYVGGAAGSIYAVAVGVAGAPVPAPPDAP